MDKKVQMSSLYGFISTNGSISLPVVKKAAESEKEESDDTDKDEYGGNESIEVGLAWKSRMLREFDETEELIEKNKMKNNRNDNQDVEGVGGRGGGGSSGGKGGKEEGGDGGKAGVAPNTKADDVWSKKIYNCCFIVKIIVVISTVASIAFGAEASPNIELLSCGYSHRPGIVSVFICLNFFIFLGSVFLIFYQVWPRSKEKFKVPIRIMDLAAFLLLLLAAMMCLICFSLWSSEALSVKLQNCKFRPKKSRDFCSTEENCGILKDMNFMAVGAIVFSTILFLSLGAGFAVVCYDIFLKNAHSTEAKQLINRLREEE